jgi:hypothetical protein
VTAAFQGISMGGVYGPLEAAKEVRMRPRLAE